MEMEKPHFAFNEYNLGIGIDNVKGFKKQIFYINSDGMALKFIQESDTTYLVENINKVWNGPPIRLQLENDLINFYPLIKFLSPYIIAETYSFINDDYISIEDLNLKDINIEITDSQVINDYGFYTKGFINADNYAVSFHLNFKKLDRTPMDVRYANSKVGYFHYPIEIDTESEKCKLVGCPKAIINRMNLKKAPWHFKIHSSIPEEYRDAVKNGILSWNNFFKELGLGEPFIAEYSDNIDPFDMRYYVVINNENSNFNGTHSGLSSSNSDYRSGENLYGLIDMNVTKMATYPIRHIIMSNENKDKLHEYVLVFITWVIAHEVGHQLGLRHNFMGNLQSDGLGSIMDYIDVFTIQNIKPLEVDFNSTSRKYDLEAIKFGYWGENDEYIKVGENFNLLFGTDENDYEIHPGVNKNIDNRNAFLYIKNCLKMYAEYRINLIEDIKNNSITPFEYGELLMFVYTNKYLELVNACLKFIGGKNFDIDRTVQIDADKDDAIQAINYLLMILSEIFYSYDEYIYFVYDFEDNEDKIYMFNNVQLDTLYQLNINGINNAFEILCKKIFEKFLFTDRLITLANQYSPLQLEEFLNIITFNGIIKLLNDELSVKHSIASQQKNMLYIWIKSLKQIKEEIDSPIIIDVISNLFVNVEKELNKLKKRHEHKNNSGNLNSILTLLVRND
jgi:hypothetical protein